MYKTHQSKWVIIIYRGYTMIQCSLQKRCIVIVITIIIIIKDSNIINIAYADTT